MVDVAGLVALAHAVGEFASAMWAIHCSKHVDGQWAVDHHSHCLLGIDGQGDVDHHLCWHLAVADGQ